MRKRKNNDFVMNQNVGPLNKRNDVKLNQYQDNSEHLTNAEFAKEFEECCGVEFGNEFEENYNENNKRNNLNIECAREYNKNSSQKK